MREEIREKRFHATTEVAVMFCGINLVYYSTNKEVDSAANSPFRSERLRAYCSLLNYSPRRREHPSERHS